MGLLAFKEQFEKEVFAKNNQPTYEWVRDKRAELSPFPTPRSLLDGLGEKSPIDIREKDFIVQAVIEVYREERLTYLSSLLCCAFFPMMNSLRCSIRGNLMESDDLDMLVITHFLEAVETIPLKEPGSSYVLAALHYSTRSQVFCELRKLAEKNRVETHCDFSTDCNPEDQRVRADLEKAGAVTPSPDATDCAKHELSADPKLRAALSPENWGRVIKDKDTLDLLTATMVYGESLKDYADRCSEGQTPEEKEKTYQRIKRQLSRAKAKLVKRYRKLLNGEIRTLGNLPAAEPETKDASTETQVDDSESEGASAEAQGGDA